MNAPTKIVRGSKVTLPVGIDARHWALRLPRVCRPTFDQVLRDVGMIYQRTGGRGQHWAWLMAALDACLPYAKETK
jgi:hypothetical protein